MGAFHRWSNPANPSRAAAPSYIITMTAYRVFDIETGPGPLAEIEHLLPAFEPPGNIKDPVKIEERRKEHRSRAIADAALSSMTGRVLAVGIKDNDGETVILDGGGDEWQLIRDTWHHLGKDRDDLRLPFVVGFNCTQFDLPFLMQRTWILGLSVPSWIRSGRWWDRRIIDLRDLWQSGNRETRGSLDAIARACAIGAKNGDGAQFADLWTSDRAKAIEYLKNDIRLTEALAVRLGVPTLAV